MDLCSSHCTREPQNCGLCIVLLLTTERLPVYAAESGLKLSIFVKRKNNSLKVYLSCACHNSCAVAKVCLLLPPTQMWAEWGAIAPFCLILLFMLCSDFCYVSISTFHCYFGSLGILIRQNHSSEMEITFILSLLHPIWYICSSWQSSGGIFIKTTDHALSPCVGTSQGIWCFLSQHWC